MKRKRIKVCLILAFVTCIVGLTRKNKIMLFITYACINLTVLTCCVLFFFVPRETTYTVFASMYIGMYLLYGSVFFIYAFRMYILLRKSDTDEMMQLRKKFLVFLCIFAVCFVGILLVASFLLIGYIRGYDYMGTFYCNYVTHPRHLDGIVPEYVY